MYISKRILIIIGIVSVIILAVLGFVAALLTQANASSTSTNSTPTPATSITATPHTAANHACASGAIQSINTQNQTFVVAEAKGAKTVTISTDSHTTFHRKGDTGLTFSALTVGQRVRVTSQSACDSTATTFIAKAITIVVPASTLTPTPITSPTPTP